MVLGNLATLAARVTDIAGSTMSETVKAAYARLQHAPAIFNVMLVQAIELLTPLYVEVTLRPTGEGADDYKVEVDYGALDRALLSTKPVRPVITVRAVREDMDRRLLTERLIDEFTPLLERLEKSVEDMRSQKDWEERWTTLANLSTAGIFSFEFFATLLFYCLIGAGALVGPYLWLLLGIGGVAYLKQMPALVLGTIGNLLFGTEIDQLERQIARARLLTAQMVRAMKIEVDTSIV